jgi:hypothetical protein
VERQGSGGLAFTIVETEEGRLAGLGGQRGQDRRSMPVLKGKGIGCGVDVEWMHSNASIIDRALGLRLALPPCGCWARVSSEGFLTSAGKRLTLQMAEWIVTLAGYDTVLRKSFCWLCLASSLIHAKPSCSATNMEEGHLSCR